MYKSLFIIIFLITTYSASAELVKAKDYAITVNGEQQTDQILVQIIIFDENDKDMGYINFYQSSIAIPKDSVKSGKIFMNLTLNKLSLVTDLLKNTDTFLLSYSKVDGGKISTGKQSIQ